MERFYRKDMKNNDLVYFRAIYLQTDLYIGASKNLSLACQKRIIELRKELDEYIALNPLFASSLAPLPVDEAAPEIAVKMYEAALKAGVGPMAAVAGAFNLMLAKSLRNETDELIIENGGDIYLKSEKTRRVSVYAGENKFKDKIHLLINPADTPLGICTSSGKFGHSLSFGKADAVCVISPDVILSDAVATAAANRIQTESDIPSAIEFAQSIKNITGIIAVCNEKIGLWGSVKLCE